MKLKAFLTTLMALLSLLVFGLGYERRDMLWMWVGFICVLVSGVFVQLFIDRQKISRQETVRQEIDRNKKETFQ